MTKSCPNCKTENPDKSEFCQNCGTNLKGSTNTLKSNETSGAGVTGFWDKQSKGGKVALGVGVCCLGLILILAISGLMTSDKTTTTAPATTAAPAATPITTNVSTTSSSSSASTSKFPLVLAEGDKVSCPECGSFNNIITNEIPSNGKYLDSFKCNNCGHRWDEPFSTPAVGTSI